MKLQKGQVSIFVIVGIILVVLVLMFLYLRGQTEQGSEGASGKPEQNPKTVFESCVKDNVTGTVELLSKQGGYLDNTLNITFLFENSTRGFQDVSYLCYTSKEFGSCTNQEPILINHLQNEIKRGTSKKVRECFDEMASNLENHGEVVEATYRDFNVTIVPRKIVITIDGEIHSTKSGETTTQRGIIGNFQSRLFEVTGVVREIVDQEAKYCNFENMGFMSFYPEFQIDETPTRNSTTIYTVSHKKGVEKFDFAVRSCSFPPGF